jgi:hypothetical protein
LPEQFKHCDGSNAKQTEQQPDVGLDTHTGEVNRLIVPGAKQMSGPLAESYRRPFVLLEEITTQRGGLF